MKKIALLIVLVIALMSCERQSGRRNPAKKIYTVEFMDPETKDIYQYIYADKDSAYFFKYQLDDERVWNKITIDTIIRN